jgi:predicted CXXCH cytochrome family protein
MIVVALAAVLVVALGGSAIAKGVSPGNRSSSYLAKGESYIEFSDAQVKMAAAGLSAEATASVHGNYSTTTVKCQVCHSAHKASVTGDTLLQSTAAQACVPCHLGATATSSKKVSAGNRHGGATQCTNGYCHSIAPHGAGDISKYATLKTAMLTNHADELLDAAIAAGAGAPVAGNIYAAGADKATATPLASIAVKNPGVTAALLNDVSTPAAIQLGKAVGTGYVCANGGCHMNGAFNSLDETAQFGAWNGNVTVDAGGYAVTLPDTGAAYTVAAGTYTSADIVNVSGTDYNVWELLHMRTSAIKGHTLAAVADLTTRNVAFANVGACSACHDSIDYRISNTAKQFPHGNDVINTDGTPAGATSSAWFMLKPYVGGTATATNGRSTTDGTFTSGMDGACLKCHRADASTGVGLTF